MAPSRPLRLQAGRGGNPEHLWLGSGGKGVFLDPSQAAVFLTALAKMALRVHLGRLADRSFYLYEIYDTAGGVLGVEMGILAGRPYIGIDDARVDVSPEDLSYFAAACGQARHLAGGIGIASKLARTPPGPRPIWENYSRRFLEDNPHPWYADD